jgi:hypothetical protein
VKNIKDQKQTYKPECLKNVWDGTVTVRLCRVSLKSSAEEYADEILVRHRVNPFFPFLLSLFCLPRA